MRANRFGIIKPSKITKNKQHVCKAPFIMFGPKIGTLFRCRCGRVYYYDLRSEYDSVPEWLPTQIGVWTSAGGLE